MDKKLIIGAVVVVLVVLGAFILLQKPAAGAEAGLVQVGELHMQMDSSSLSELEKIIHSNADNYTRERALTSYADVALRTGNGEQALVLLRELAYNETNDDVRTSAYTNYYWLKEEMGKGPDTTMDVQVRGDIKPGNNITVVVTLANTRGSNLTTLILWPSPLDDVSISNDGSNIVDVNTGKGAYAQAHVTPSTRLSLELQPNVSQEIEYTVYLKGPGQTVLKAAAEVRYAEDRLDYDQLEKDIFLDVGSSEGNYTIMEQ